MSLHQCMQARGLEGALREGLRALGRHSRCVEVTAPRRPSHSVALDEALKAQFPEAPRWDYGIGLTNGNASAIAWIEVHPATSSDVDKVLAKLQWLREWLKQSNDACGNVDGSFHWLATGGVHIDPVRLRKLNAAGLQRPRSILKL